MVKNQFPHPFHFINIDIVYSELTALVHKTMYVGGNSHNYKDAV